MDINEYMTVNKKINLNKVKSMVVNECANYLGDSFTDTYRKYCCLRDKACIYFEERKDRCRYFEVSVLPINSELEFKYNSAYHLKVDESKLKPKAICERCKKQFDANSNRQKYCDFCKKIVQRDKARERMNKKRNVTH